MINHCLNARDVGVSFLDYLRAQRGLTGAMQCARAKKFDSVFAHDVVIDSRIKQLHLNMVVERTSKGSLNELLVVHLLLRLISLMQFGEGFCAINAVMDYVSGHVTVEWRPPTSPKQSVLIKGLCRFSSFLARETNNDSGILAPNKYDVY